jgi:hypothetical protein
MIRNSVYFFTLLALFAIAAFWPSYLSRATSIPEVRVHLHGAVMALWVAMLITQAFLIRNGARPTHRLIGKASYVLAPLIVLSTLALAHLRLHEAGDDPPVDLLYFVYVQLAMLSLFVLAYVLAIKHRKTPQLHARYMACTALALFDPIFARLLYNHLGIDFPLAQVITYTAMDAILLGLALWDWRHDRRPSVYPAMLGIFVLVQLPTFFLYKLPVWRKVAVWYGSLPIP